MRIAHVTATFPPYLAGTGYVAYYQTRELARLGHDVHVFTTAIQGPSSYVSPDGVTIHRLPAIMQIGNAPVLPQLLGLAGFDLVHQHYPFISGAELAWATAYLRGVPYVVHYHNDLIGTGLRDTVFRAYSRVSGERIVAAADRIVVVSLDHALNCKASSIFQSRGQRVEELPNGVDTDHFRPGLDASSVRQRARFSQDAQVILFVGALDAAHHFKGLSTLLRAFTHVQAADKRLMVVGGGDLLDRYRREAAALGIEQRTFFAGCVPHAELPAYYAAADIAVLPSSPPESFGMVIIEAMACGRPVIGSRIPGVRSLIDERRDGLLAEAGDAADLAAKLNALLGLPAGEREAMGLAGRRKVETRYTWTRIGAQLDGLYAEILATRQHREDQKVQGTP